MNRQQQELLQLLEISVEDLIDDYGSGAISRGIGYFRASKVLSFKEMEVPNEPTGSTVVSGTISGNYASTYQTTLTILRTDDFNHVFNRCSCPVSFCCKHGIALLFTYLNHLSQFPERLSGDLNIHATEIDEIDHWLSYINQSELENNTEEPSHEESKYQYHAIYILDLCTPNPVVDHQGFCIRMVKARVLKKGGYGTLANLHPGDLSGRYGYYSQPNYYFNDYDRQVAIALDACQSTGYAVNEKYILSGELGMLILNNSVRTGRCFWNDYKNNAPLSEGAKREIKLEWLDEDGVYVPNIKCEPPVHILAELDQLTYIDDVNGECGPLTHPSLNTLQLSYFMNAPKISKENAKDISYIIAQKLPELDFPLPTKVKIESIEIKGKDVVVHLKLHAVNKHSGSSNAMVHMASMSFQYGDVNLQPQSTFNKDVTTFFKDRKKITVHRQIDKELAAINTMKKAGFENSNITNRSLLDMVIFGETTVEQSVEKWDKFLNDIVPQLEASGWVIKREDSFNLDVEQIDDWYAELSERDGGDWFDMSLGFKAKGKRINLLPMLVDLLARYSNKESLHKVLSDKPQQLLQLNDSQWIKIPSERIIQILDTIIELYDTDSLDAGGNLRIAKHASLHFNELLNDPSLKWKGAKELKLLNNKLRDFSGIKPVSLPKGLKAELRDYQKLGVDWLQFLRRYEFNGILADDMGLGKTVQTLTNLLIEKRSRRADRPNLVIAPTSLMSNWRNEAARFTPQLKVVVLQGSNRKERFSQINDADIVLTTYPLMLRDTEFYKDQSFHYLILDEAQAIKNAKAKTTQIIYELQARHRLCVTGTPMENHLGEIWSMYHFLMPGYLGTHQRFTRLFKTPIEKNADYARSQNLSKRIEPFLLRRTKELVAEELPEKTQILRTVALMGKQHDLYESVRVAMDKQVRDEINKKGFARSHIMILDALLKLRQVCCDPQLINLKKAQSVKESAKLSLLMDLVPEMVEEGRKILIFSQFVTMLGIIEKKLTAADINYSKLTGQTRKREEAIKYFQEGDAKVFLISLKAGGVGLNLTAADTVIHYDPWWNPAVENQATDRAHRIGQDKPVFVYKLLTEGTVEEKILAMQEKKQALADSLYTKKMERVSAFGQSDLLELLRPLE